MNFFELVKKSREKLVIVEGSRDKIALEKLGFRCVYVLKKMPIFKFVEVVLKREFKQVLILTDLDSEGKMLYKRLKSELGNFGITVDDKIRDFLFKETKLRQIEGLTRYLDRHPEEFE